MNDDLFATSLAARMARLSVTQFIALGKRNEPQILGKRVKGSDAIVWTHEEINAIIERKKR